MLFLFPSCGHYWSWPTVTNPIPFSQACGQRSSVIWSDPQVYSEPWMDLSVVVLIGFWTILSPTWLCGSNLVGLLRLNFWWSLSLILPSSFFPLGMPHQRPDDACVQTSWNIDTDTWILTFTQFSVTAVNTNCDLAVFMLVRNLTSAHWPCPTSS